MLAVARAERVARLGVRRLVLLGGQQRRGVALLELDGVDLAEPRGHRDHPLGELEVAPVVAADLGDDVGSRHDAGLSSRAAGPAHPGGQVSVRYRPARWRPRARPATVLADLVRAYARRDPPRSVTIVGNAPLPPCPQRAALIDDSDLVVRMTTFALDAPEDRRCIGRRTDVVLLHRAVVPGPGTFHDHASRLYLLVEPGRLHWEREDRPDWWPVHPVSVPNHPFTVALKELMGIPADEAAWPTTGTLAVYVFSELFPAASGALHGHDRRRARRSRPSSRTAGAPPSRSPPNTASPRRARCCAGGRRRPGSSWSHERRVPCWSPRCALLLRSIQIRIDNALRAAEERGEHRLQAVGRPSCAQRTGRRGRRAAPASATSCRRDHERRTDELHDQLRRISGQLVALEQRVGPTWSGPPSTSPPTTPTAAHRPFAHRRGAPRTRPRPGGPGRDRVLRGAHRSAGAGRDPGVS